MYASEQGILNEQMNAAIMACNNEELKERLLVITMLKPRFGKDGNQYFYILGSLPEPDCIAGFGDTPELAMIAFTMNGKAPKTPQASAPATVSYYSPMGEDTPTPVSADISSVAGLASFSKTELEQHVAKLEYQLGEINEHGLGDSDTALTKWTIERDLKIFKADLDYR